MIPIKFFVSFLAFALFCSVCGLRHGNKRMRGRKRADPNSKVTFDAACKIACHGKFCMTAFAMCKYMKGIHPCCGGKPPKPSSPTHPPPPSLPPPSPSSQYTPSPLNCKQISGGEYCAFYPNHPCCKTSPVPRTPPPKVCLFGTCITKPKIKFEFPSCRILEPPKFGEVTLTAKLYCNFLNPKHKCCKRLNHGKNPAVKPYIKPIRTPKRQVNLKTPNLSSGHHKKLPPPEAPSPPSECFGIESSQKSALQMKNLRRKDNKRQLTGSLLSSSGMDNPGIKVPLESLSLVELCDIEPTHRCCITNSTGTPPVPPPPGVKPDMVIIPNTNNTSVSGMASSFACDYYTYNLNYCRTNKNCGVNCADRTCRKISEIPYKCTTDCSSNCEDICGCKRSGCQYDFNSKNCRPLRVCLNENFGRHQECRRPSAYYSVGGEMCLNKMSLSSEDCSIDYVVLAVNLGGERFIDSRGIAYQADKEVEYEDKQDIRKIGTSPKVLGVPIQDTELYQTFIYGATESRARKRCVVYKVPICEDGLYELSVRTLDNYHNYKGKRLFNVEFNGYLVFPEVDVLALSQATYKAIDLNLNFLMLNGATVMHLSKHKNHRLAVMNPAEIPLKFCYSGCSKVEDPNFIVSAFSVVKFKGSRNKGDEGKERSKSKCGTMHFDMCGCKKSGCEYDVVKGLCLEGNQVCGKNDKKSLSSSKCGQMSFQSRMSMFATSGPLCRRPGVYYADGGSVCLNEEALDECKIEEIVVAVNINGDDLVDEKGIRFQQERSEMYRDPLGTRMDVVGVCFDERNSDSMKSRTFPLEEVTLYSEMIVGTENQRDVGRCISYRIPGNLQKDGKYELGMKFTEYQFTKSKRYFNVRFADILVLPEFDILSYVEKCVGIDVIVPFEVNGNGTKLNVLGHPEIPIGENRIELSFCYGECTLDEQYTDPDYLAGAFYVAKMSE